MPCVLWTLVYTVWCHFAADVIVTVPAGSSLDDLACVNITAPDNCNLNKEETLELTLMGSADGSLYVPARGSSATVYIVDDEGTQN